jgi:aquaporin rerated protein, other eukaryote
MSYNKSTGRFAWFHSLGNQVVGSIPDGVRNHMVAALAELSGTFLFLFFALSIAQAANTPVPLPGSLPDTSKLLFIALGFGCSVAVNVWIFYRVSGGMFNPAVRQRALQII